ncbi:MAG: hypothetical protein EBX50_17875 [Chitinophagia bacterium]|nr:hypothetical protein [Chitinophagia bacterium]
MWVCEDTFFCALKPKKLSKNKAVLSTKFGRLLASFFIKTLYKNESSFCTKNPIQAACFVPLFIIDFFIYEPTPYFTAGSRKIIRISD